MLHLREINEGREYIEKTTTSPEGIKQPNCALKSTSLALSVCLSVLNKMQTPEADK